MEQLETSNTAGDTRLAARRVVDWGYIEQGLDGSPNSDKPFSWAKQVGASCSGETFRYLRATPCRARISDTV
jgi:hypothetical protein